MKSVVIIGAGPYGLSLAAYLRAAGVELKIFGKAMGVWRDQMPHGMLLKSDGCASNLEEPQGAFTLRSYCEQRGIPYDDRLIPVSRDTFIAYALAFQKEFVPDLDPREVVRIERAPRGNFVVHLSSGEPVPCERVVVAVGVSHFRYVPEMLAALPGESVSHSSEHTDLARFKDRDVAVIGAGASALDTAALLHRQGSRVTLVSRRDFIDYIDPPRPGHSLLERITDPQTDIGPGWKNVFCTQMPRVFYFLPEAFRGEVVRRHLGPQPGWFTRELTEGRFPFMLGATPVQASQQDGRVTLKVNMADGSSKTLQCDHVIAATGYKVDLSRIPFLQDDLLRQIDAKDGTPRLSLNFESSMPGLYFTGLAAARNFGPVLRFACGSKFATPLLSRHLVRTTSAGPAPNASRRASA